MDLIITGSIVQFSRVQLLQASNCRTPNCRTSPIDARVQLSAPNCRASNYPRPVDATPDGWTRSLIRNDFFLLQTSMAIHGLTNSLESVNLSIPLLLFNKKKNRSPEKKWRPSTGLERLSPR